MPFKNGKYFDSTAIQAVDNAISSVNKLPNIRITYFRHSPTASRIVSQNCLCMINQGIYKPDSALYAVTCNEFLNLNQIFTGFL